MYNVSQAIENQLERHFNVFPRRSANPSIIFRNRLSRRRGSTRLRTTNITLSTASLPGVLRVLHEKRVRDVRIGQARLSGVPRIRGSASGSGSLEESVRGRERGDRDRGSIVNNKVHRSIDFQIGRSERERLAAHAGRRQEGLRSARGKTAGGKRGSVC